MLVRMEVLLVKRDDLPPIGSPQDALPVADATATREVMVTIY